MAQYTNFMNETPRGKLRGISTKDISNNNAASSGVFTLRENKLLKGKKTIPDFFEGGLIFLNGHY